MDLNLKNMSRAVLVVAFLMSVAPVAALNYGVDENEVFDQVRDAVRTLPVEERAAGKQEAVEQLGKIAKDFTIIASRAAQTASLAQQLPDDVAVSCSSAAMAKCIDAQNLIMDENFKRCYLAYFRTCALNMQDEGQAK